MNRIPTPGDWRTDPEGALAASLAVAKATASHGDPTATSVALGVAAEVLKATAPAVGQAIGGPLGALASAALVGVVERLTEEQATHVTELTPSQAEQVKTIVKIGLEAIKENRV